MKVKLYGLFTYIAAGIILFSLMKETRTYRKKKQKLKEKKQIEVSIKKEEIKEVKEKKEEVQKKKVKEEIKKVPAEKIKKEKKKQVIEKKRKIKQVPQKQVQKKIKKKVEIKEEITAETVAEIETPVIKKEEKKFEIKAFSIGEKLRGVVRFAGINCGIMSAEVKNGKLNGKEILKLVINGRTNRFFDFIYKYRQSVVSYIDKDYFYSYGFDLYRRKRKKEKKKSVRFDYKNNWIIINGEKKEKLDEKLIDIASAYYYFRNLDIKVGDKIKIPIHDGKKKYDLVIDVLRKEKLKTQLGKLECFVISPKLKFEGEFETEGNSLIWVTADVKKLPVKIKLTIFKIGLFDAIITDYKAK